MKENDTLSLIWTWNLRDKTVSAFLLKEGIAPRFLVKERNHSQWITPHFIKGIPTDILKNKKALQHFLSQSHIKLNLLDNGEYSLLISLKLLGGGNTIDPRNELNKIWPNGVVPYEIDIAKYPVDASERKIILEAIQEWNNSNTGFTLIPRIKQTDFLIFGDEEGVCYSNVGRQGGAQYVRCDLGISGSFDKGSVLHEIGHTVGLYHEHQRLDREKYISAPSGDSPDSAADYAKQGKPFGSYDFDSIMHYQVNVPLSDGNQLTTKSHMPLSRTKLIGTHQVLSEGDIQAIQDLARYSSHSLRPQRSSSSSSTMYRRPQYECMQERADWYFDRGHFKTARRIYDALAKEYENCLSDEDISRYINQAGRCSYKLKEFERALQAFQAAATWAPENINIQKNIKIARGELQRQQQELEQSWECRIL